MSEMSRVPARPVAPYRGGKRNLARRITSIIDAVPHKTYAEPFVGLGGIFLRRCSRPDLEVVNDLSYDIANFYRIVQRHYAPLVDLLRFQISSRAEFERLQAQDAKDLTDLERAARFLYLQTNTYGGKVSGRTFGTSRHREGRFNLFRIGSLLQDFHDRLAGVVVERLPFERFIPIYDSPDTLMYLDPPYWGGEQDYGASLFSRMDFQRLRGLLSEVRGRFILSINDIPETRSLFAEFEVAPVRTRYGLQSGSALASELIVTNFQVGDLCI
jgi:DNA adenine methylase